MKMLKPILLALGLFMSSTLSAVDYTAEVTAVYQLGSCTVIEVTVYDGDGDEVGTSTISIPGGSGAGCPNQSNTTSLDSLQPVASYEQIEVKQDSANKGTIEVNYRGNEYERGTIDPVFGDEIDLKGRDLDFKGKEMIDVSDLEDGHYVITFRGKDNRVAIGTFEIE